jgi:SWI/SNF-related matrix-associated actin-dependent regulator 1 of chromatin subfamily A
MEDSEMAIVNKFEKNCSACQKTVFAGEGVAVNYSDEWYTYHNDCVPAEFQNQSVKKDVNRPSEITEDGCIFIPFNAGHVELIKTIPNRSWDKQQGCWKFPLTKASIQRAVEVGKILNIKIAESLLSEFVEQPKCRNFNKLFDYQKEGANFLASHSAALLGDEMGTGKTIQTLCALPMEARVLIVCPSSLKFNWVKESNKWRPDYKVSVLNSTKAVSEYEVEVLVGKDKFRLPNKNEILIVNRELLPDFLLPKKTEDSQYPVCALEDNFKNVLNETYLIVDEAHQYKGTKTSGHKKLRTLSRNTKSTWALTGTPLLSRPEDLWGVFAACNLEKIVFNKYGTRPYDYFFELFNGRKARFGVEWGTPSPELPDLISRVRLARKRKDVLPQLPDKIYTNILVSLDSSSGEVIKKTLDNLEKEYASILSRGSLPPLHAFSSIRTEIAKSRIPAMMEYVNECEEQEVPLVIFSAHRAPLDALRLQKGWGIIDKDTKPHERQMIIDDFDSGKIKGIASTIYSGGTGFNMTRAWKVLFVDLDWVPALNKQSEDRVCRFGQKSNKVEIIRFISDHPLDRRLFELLDQKETLIAQTFEKEAHQAVEPEKVPVKNGRNYVEVICEYESARSNGVVPTFTENEAVEKAQLIINTKPEDTAYPLISRTDVKALKNLIEKYSTDSLYLKALCLIVGRYEVLFNRIKSND